MDGHFSHELAFMKIQDIVFVTEIIHHPESKKMRQMQYKKKGDVGCLLRCAVVQSLDDILYKIKKFRMGIRLFQAFLQQLNHKKQNGILYHISKQFIVMNGLLAFLDALQRIPVILINNHLQYIAHLKLGSRNAIGSF